MHSQLQGMMFRPIQMSFRCLPIFPIGVSFGCLRCQLAAINLLAYGFASKDASRGRFRDSDCSLPPLLLDDVCCLFAYLSSCAAHPPQAWALCDVAPENSFSVLLACGWSSLYMFKYCQQFGCSGSMGGVTYIQIQRLSDSYAWCSKMCIALILVTEAWNSLPSGSCWQQACGTDIAQVSRHGWSWMGQLKERMSCLPFPTLRKLNYDCYRSRGFKRCIQSAPAERYIPHPAPSTLPLGESKIYTGPWLSDIWQSGNGHPAQIIVLIESKSFPCSALWVEFGSNERKRVVLSVCTRAPHNSEDDGLQCNNSTFWLNLFPHKPVD